MNAYCCMCIYMLSFYFILIFCLYLVDFFFFALTGLIYYHMKVKHFVVVDVLLKISTI